MCGCVGGPKIVTEVIQRESLDIVQRLPLDNSLDNFRPLIIEILTLSNININIWKMVLNLQGAVARSGILDNLIEI